MSGVKGEIKKALTISLLTLWAFIVAAFLIIHPLYDAHVIEIGNQYGHGPSLMTLKPMNAVIVGVFLSILLLLHWWLSGLFGSKGISTKPLANLMLVLAGVCALFELFEHGSQDFYEYSFLCKSSEPTRVVLVDEIYQCERQRLIRRIAQWLTYLLPILAIPVRLIESRSEVSEK